MHCKKRVPVEQRIAAKGKKDTSPRREPEPKIEVPDVPADDETETETEETETETE